MHYLGWIISAVTEEEKQQVIPDLMSLVCEYFHLCASLGCACLTDVGDKICNEVVFGTYFPHHYSEGPTWSACATVLENCIRLDIHFNGPIIGTELVNFRTALGKYNIPIFTAQGSGGNF